MKKAMPWVLISVGIVFLLVAGALLIYSRLGDFLAGQRSDSVLRRVLSDEWELSEIIDPDLFFSDSILSAEALENTNDELFPEIADDNESEDGTEGEKTPLVYSVIGILEIPKLNKKLPVLDRSIPALLNISICRYSGRVEEKPIRLVIAGHNLNSHFGKISTLVEGDEILFTTRDGAVFRYRLIGIDECHKSEEEAVQAGSEWDITLLTCKRDRTMRNLVRFAEIPEIPE